MGTRAGTVPQSLMAPTFLALGVLEAEAGLVSLRHLGAVGGQDVVVGEDIHAVVVPARGSPQRPGCTSARERGGMLGAEEDPQGADRTLALPCGGCPPQPAQPLAVGEGPHSRCSEAAVLRGRAELSPALGRDMAVSSQTSWGLSCRVQPAALSLAPPAPTLPIQVQP